jgi:hypothetical protein
MVTRFISLLLSNFSIANDGNPTNAAPRHYARRQDFHFGFPVLNSGPRSPREKPFLPVWISQNQGTASCPMPVHRNLGAVYVEHDPLWRIGGLCFPDEFRG